MWMNLGCFFLMQPPSRDGAIYGIKVDEERELAELLLVSSSRASGWLFELLLKMAGSHTEKKNKVIQQAKELVGWTKKSKLTSAC